MQKSDIDYENYILCDNIIKINFYAKNHDISLCTRGIVQNSNTLHTHATASYWHKTSHLDQETTVAFSASGQGVGITVYNTISMTTQLSRITTPANVGLYFIGNCETHFVSSQF